ncbi:unnamed protein product [Linum trigynum]|uniref:Uncharacterized protein n=1 Tax=Linum trigynum TaxID=586398 RepID=A0AAV2CW69_9ROSI
MKWSPYSYFMANHTAIFNPSGDRNASADVRVREWIWVGFPATKLVLRLSYHGYVWKLANSGDNALGAPTKGPNTAIAWLMGVFFYKDNLFFSSRQSFFMQRKPAERRGALGLQASIHQAAAR